MAGNVPAISRNSFDFDKSYGPVYLQEGVPIMDSDWNEALDNLWVRGVQLSNKALFGNVRLAHYAPDGTVSSDSGFQIVAGGGNNNFTISDGYACCHGVLVSSTDSSPPIAVTYNDQVITTGTATAVGAGQLTDSSKNWDSGHQLVGCIVRMTSGIDSGSDFTITSLDSATVVTLSGGTGSIAPTNTYEIVPPVLTTPSGAGRTDLAYLQVFFEDTATEEDSTVTHPDTGLESVHKVRVRSVVRVLEGSATLPTTATTITDGYGVRYMTLGTITRLDGVAAIATLTPAANFRDNLENLTSESLTHDTSAIAALGYTIPAGTDTLGEVLDQVLTVLAGEASPNVGADLIGQEGVTDLPDSLTAGTVMEGLTELLEFINNRVTAVHPTVSVTAPELLWRSGGVELDANITGETVSIYLLPPNTLATSASARLAVCTGFYLNAATAYKAVVAPLPTQAVMIISGDEMQTLSKYPLTASWLWASAASWTGGVSHIPGALLTVLDPAIFASGIALGADSYIQPVSAATLHPLIRTVDSTPNVSGGMYTDGKELWITHNVVWNAGTSTWSTVDTARNAHAVLFGSEFLTGINMFFQSIGETDHTGSWSRYNWGSTQTIGSTADSDMSSPSGHILTGFTSSGNTYEKLHFSGRMRHDHEAGASTAAALPPCMSDSCNLRARRSVTGAPYHLTFTAEATRVDGSGIDNTDASLDDYDEWGCTVLLTGNQGTGITFLSSLIYGGQGYVEIYD